MLTEISLLVLSAVIALIVVFDKSYLARKGENLATKEDIAEITAKIEVVKSIFNERFENYKSRKRRYDARSIAAIQAERRAVERLHRCACEMIYGPLLSNLMFTDERLGITLDEYEITVNEQITAFLVAYQNLRLYPGYIEKFSRTADDLYQIAVDTIQVFNMHYRKVVAAIEKRKKENIVDLHDPTAEVIGSFMKRRDKPRERFVEEFSEFVRQSQGYFKDINEA